MSIAADSVAMVYNPLVLYAVLAVSTLALITLGKVFKSRKNDHLRKIPTVGPSFPGLSYLGAAQLLLNSSSMIQDGYDRYKQSIFKVADFRSWVIFVSHPQHLEDIRKAPPEVLGFDAAIDQALHALAPTIRQSHMHVPIVQNQLTRALHTTFPNIEEEVTTAFKNVLMPIGKEWEAISALDVALDVACRTTHRMFVGMPLCRQSDYIEFTKQFALDISKAAGFIRFFPYPIRGHVGRLFVDVPGAIARMKEFLRPHFTERLRNIEAFGVDDSGNPDDMLSWFTEVVDGETDEDKLTHVAFHMLTLDFGGVYTTTTSFTQALHHLAANPELIEPLREEVESVIAKEGWTKNALGGMKKMDSFFKESQRLTGLAAVSTYRAVLKDFVFSDGAVVPAGTTLAVTAHCTHMDDTIYPNAETFDGFRFANADDEKSLFVTPSPHYLPFGMGRHTCPGRFFTITVMKMMMARLILEYDIELKGDEGEQTRSRSSWFGLDYLPSSAQDLLIRRRHESL